MIASEHVSCAGKTGLYFISDEDNSVFSCEFRETRHEPFGWDYKTTFALNGLNHNGCDIFRSQFLFHFVDHEIQSFSSAFFCSAWPAQWVCHRHSVDLWSERAKTLFVWQILRCHCHSEVGTPVIGMLKNDHCLSLGVIAGNLHRVLNCFGT